MADFNDAVMQLERIAGATDFATEAAAQKMADTFNDGVKREELSRYAHPPYTWSPSPPGEPPAAISGRLRDSMTVEPAHPDGPYRWVSRSGPTTVYSRIQELGGDMHGNPEMHWYINGIGWFDREFVHLPARPYMKPASIRMSEDGSLTAAAIEGFAPVVGAAAG